MNSKKHWSPGGEVSIQSVERSDSGGWIVSGSLTPNGICPDCGLHSRRRHGWRRRRLQDYPAHGDEVTVDLAVCRWRCLAPACPRRTFSDQIASIARPFARRTSRAGEIVSHLGHAAGGRPAERLLCRLGLGVTTEDGSVIAMSGADGTLTIDPLLITGHVPAENQLNRIVRVFETLDFADVRAGMASNSEAAGPALQASLEDGTTITLTQVSGSDGADETRWFRIDVSGNTELASTTAGFEFSMSSSDAEVFSWTLDDLTEETAS